MITAPTLLLLAWLAPGPVCGAGEGLELRRGLLLEVNLGRLAAGARPLRPHPALCQVAGRRAAEVAADGGADPDLAVLDRLTRAVYRGGYRPHNWTESVLIGDRRAPLLEQWRSVRPAWVDQAVAGNFEDVGIGTSRRDGQEVISLILALPALAVERRQAALLADLSRVRADLLTAVNGARRRLGRSALTPSPELDAAAQRHAEDMLARGYYSHRSPEGESVAERVRAAGYGRARVTSENIAKGIFAPTEVVERWLASPGHRENILRSRVTELGSGVAVGEVPEGVEVVWVQVFAGR